jgi:cell division septation protein DedD
MNQKDGARWELRLGLFQVVILLGLLMGLLTCVFFVGLFSGRQVGHEAALNASLSNTIKLPIATGEIEELAEQANARNIASDVYAKLNQEKEAAAVDPGAPNDSADVPKLGAIDSTDVAPVNDNVLGEEKQVVDAQVPSKLPDIVEDVPSKESRDQLLKQVIALDQQNNNIPESLPVQDPPAVIPVTKEVAKVGELEKAVEKLPTKAPATPTAAKVKEPVKEAADQGTNIPKGWFAQVAAPKKKEDAQALSKQLRKSGFEVILEVAQVRGEQYYRVLAGPEASKAQVEKLVEQLKREPYVPSQPFIRQIK